MMNEKGLKKSVWGDSELRGAGDTRGPESTIIQRQANPKLAEDQAAVGTPAVDTCKTKIDDGESVAENLDRTEFSEPGPAGSLYSAYSPLTRDGGETNRRFDDRTVGFDSHEPADGFALVDDDKTQPSARSLIGKSIGNYEVLAELGRGGMGVVYKARERKLNRIVALKMILAGSHASAETISRFTKEARAVAHLQHPGIVQVFEIGNDNGLPLFSLEYVDGPSLDAMFKNKPASPKQAAKIVIALAETMQYAHDHGIIHRDLKPANVLMNHDGNPKITDFGLAKQVEEDDGETRTGTIMGTPGYMSPEQALGKTKELSPASDQYALGAVLYRLVSGRAPFVSSRAMDTLIQVIKLDPVPLRQLSPEVPLDLETICLKTLLKEPHQRYENCQALANDLQRFLNDEPIVARPISSVEKLTRWCKRNPKIASLVATSFALLLAVAGLMTWSTFAIAKERDNVQTQKQKADDNLVIAIQNEEKANANALLAQENERKAKESEALAKEQAVKIVKTMQNVLTEIDAPLKQDPKFAKTRLEVMQALSKTYNDLEIELHTDVKSGAIPTLMAIRFNLVQIFQSLNEGKLANDEIKKVYEMSKTRIVVKEGTDAARSNLAKICLVHALITEKAEGIEASKPLLDEALSVSRDIIANPKPSEESGTPPLYDLKYVLSNALQSNGVYHYNRGSLNEAAKYFQEAGQIRQEILDDLDADKTFLTRPVGYQQAFRNAVKTDASRSTLGAATILLKLGNTEEGIAAVQSVYDRVQKEYDTDPSEANEKELGKMGDNFGLNCFKIGRLEQADELMKKSAAIIKKFADANPDDYDSQYTYTVSLYRYASMLEERDPAEAQTRFDRCVEIREKQYAQDQNLKNETMLMVAYARSKKTAKAIEIADRLSTNAELEGKMRVDIARAYIQCSRLIESDEAKQQLIQKSLTTIQQAVDGGYGDWFELQTEPDLSPLQNNAEFQAIIAKLKA